MSAIQLTLPAIALYAQRVIHAHSPSPFQQLFALYGFRNLLLMARWGGGGFGPSFALTVVGVALWSYREIRPSCRKGNNLCVGFSLCSMGAGASFKLAMQLDAKLASFRLGQDVHDAHSAFRMSGLRLSALCAVWQISVIKKQGLVQLRASPWMLLRSNCSLIAVLDGQCPTTHIYQSGWLKTVGPH